MLLAAAWFWCWLVSCFSVLNGVGLAKSVVWDSRSVVTQSSTEWDSPSQLCGTHQVSCVGLTVRWDSVLNWVGLTKSVVWDSQSVVTQSSTECNSSSQLCGTHWVNCVCPQLNGTHQVSCVGCTRSVASQSSTEWDSPSQLRGTRWVSCLSLQLSGTHQVSCVGLTESVVWDTPSQLCGTRSPLCLSPQLSGTHQVSCLGLAKSVVWDVLSLLCGTHRVHGVSVLNWMGLTKSVVSQSSTEWDSPRSQGSDPTGQQCQLHTHCYNMNAFHNHMFLNVGCHGSWSVIGCTVLAAGTVLDFSVNYANEYLSSDCAEQSSSDCAEREVLFNVIISNWGVGCEGASRVLS